MSQEHREIWSPERLTVANVQFSESLGIVVAGEARAREVVEGVAGILGAEGVAELLDWRGLGDFRTPQSTYYIRRDPQSGEYDIDIYDERFSKGMELRDQLEGLVGPQTPSIYVDLIGDPADIGEFWQRQCTAAHARLNEVVARIAFGNTILFAYGQLLNDAARRGDQEGFKRAWREAQGVLTECGAITEAERQELFGEPEGLPGWSASPVADREINPHLSEVALMVSRGTCASASLQELNLRWAQKLGLGEAITEPLRNKSVVLANAEGVGVTFHFDCAGRLNLSVGAFEVTETGGKCRVVVSAEASVGDDRIHTRMQEALCNLTLGHPQTRPKVDALYAS